jgi:hypothetical protein
MEIDCTDFLGGGRGYGDGGGLPLFQTRGGGDWKVKKKKKEARRQQFTRSGRRRYLCEAGKPQRHRGHQQARGFIALIR